LVKKPAAKKKLTPVTLVTGASSGIGAALAGVFGAHGRLLALTARRKAHLEDVASAIAAAGGKPPFVIVADLGTPSGPDKLARSLKSRDLEVANLINAAGFARAGATASFDAEQHLTMIDLNARALTDLCLRFADSIAYRRGGILNVAAAGTPPEGMAVYAATKAYVLSLSEALFKELEGRVRVSALCFDHAATPLREIAEAAYRGFKRGDRVIAPDFARRARSFTAQLSRRRT
jgi:short-subunit dehydrogenase